MASASKNDALQRWSKIRIDQLGFVNNLLIGLASGMLTLEAGAAFDKLATLAPAVQHMVWRSLLFLLASILIGIITALNRLYDFRKTAQTVRLRIRRARNRRNARIPEPERLNIDRLFRDAITSLRTLTRLLGSLTWGLLCLQILLFLVGTVLLVCAVQQKLRFSWNPFST